jgi:hypothetical protein
MNSVSINNHVLSEILISVEASLVWARWLVDRPVVEWGIPDWILVVSLDQIVSINSINNDISKLQVLISSVSRVVCWRWLVNRPVVEWWIPNWVLNLSKLQTVRFLDLSKFDSDWGWLVDDEVLEVTNGNVIVHKSEIITFDLGELGGDWGWLVNDEVLKMSNSDIVVHEGKVIATDLSEFDSDWGWLIDDKVLEVTNGDVVVHESEVISTNLSELDSNWRWFVDDEILEVTNGNIVIHEGEVVTFDLGKLGGDWSWLVNNQILQMGSGHVVIHKGEVIALRG